MKTNQDIAVLDFDVLRMRSKDECVEQYSYPATIKASKQTVGFFDDRNRGEQGDVELR